MVDPTGPVSPQPGALHRPVAHLLRPLIRLLIRSGLTFPALCDLLRELFIDVAEQEFALSAKPQTDSRISLLTGIHRKEVSRLRGTRAARSTVTPAASRTSRILAAWMGGALYTDAAGRPLPLPRVARGGGPSFETLVESVTRDVRPRAVLDEWIERRLVTMDADARVVLLASAFIPQAGEEEMLYYFGRNLHDHMAAAVSNVSREGRGFLERSVHYDGLSKALADDLHLRSREIAIDALKAANHEAIMACETDAGGAWRWNFGIYVYATEDPPVAPTTEADRPRRRP